MPNTCFVGRILFRDDQLAGLDWGVACPVPAEEIMVMDPEPEMYFCAPHFQAIAATMYAVFARLGLIDHGIGGGPQDATDGLEQAWGSPDLRQHE